MRLFGRRQWILSIIGLVGGMFLSSYVLKMRYGVINFWIIGLVGIIGLIVILAFSKYADKEN